MPNRGLLRPSRNEPLPPRVLQIVGLLAAVAQGVFWAASGRLEPTLLATAGALIGIGHYTSAVKGLTTHDYPPDQLPPATTPAPSPSPPAA